MNEEGDRIGRDLVGAGGDHEENRFAIAVVLGVRGNRSLSHLGLADETNFGVPLDYPEALSWYQPDLCTFRPRRP
jgi:hypothetical protein